MGLYFFSGKGGVGKTHLATSFAFNRAGVGRRVLLIEFSRYAQYVEYFNLRVGSTPLELRSNLFVSSWTGRDCLKEYVGKVLKSQKASDFFMKMPLMEKLINVAPGLKEISILGKLTSDYREINFSTGFEDIIFDAPSSGHLVSLIGVPESLGNIVGAGPMKKQCLEVLNTLQKNKDVFFGLIDDGSKFSKKEALETNDKLQKILNEKNVNMLHNFSNEFPRIDCDKWLDSTEQLSSYWESFQWK